MTFYLKLCPKITLLIRTCTLDGRLIRIALCHSPINYPINMAHISILNSYLIVEPSIFLQPRKMTKQGGKLLNVEVFDTIAYNIILVYIILVLYQ